MDGGWVERACGVLLAAVSLLVPADRRTAWREEWESEVWHQVRRRSNRRGPVSGLAVVFRCLGAVPHALWIRRGRWKVHAMWTNLRLSARGLARDPAFSVPAILVFGLAVSAAAMLFASYEAVVLRVPGYEDPDRLVSVWAEDREERGWYQEYVAPANFFDWREQVSAFDDVAAYGDYTHELIMTEGGEADVVDAGQVTGNLFDVLGAGPALGRTFRMEETWSDTPPVVVLSHDFWQRRFGGDPEAVGRRIELSGVRYEIVGVMPPDFRYLAPDKELWVPFRWDPETLKAPFFRRAHLVRTVARISDLVTPAEATEQLRTVASRLAEAYPATNEGLSAGTTPLGEYLTGDRGETLRALLVAVGILLFAACVNVGYLVLVRWRRRRREVAIRRALGAGNRTLTRDAAVESMLLSVLGGGLGIVGSVFGMQVLSVMAPPELLASTELRLSAPLVLTAVGVVAGAAVLFTLLPLHGALSTLPATVASQGTRAAVSVKRGRGIHGFVVLQVALSAALIFSAALLARSFVTLRSVEPGFDASGVLSFAVPFPDQSDEAAAGRLATAEQITDDLRGLQGVVSVGTTREIPITGSGWTSSFSIEEEGSASSGFEIVHRTGDAGYFETMRVPVVRGRLIGEDEEDAALVNETFARRAFGSGDPMGRRIAYTSTPDDQTTWYRIVGVVGDERQNGLRSEVRPEVFNHFTFDIPATFRFVVRTGSDPSALVPRVRDVVRGVDPGLPMDEIATLDDVVSSSLAGDRFVTLIAGAFAVLAGLLAVVGVYGVTAQVAAGWEREFAVRLALGARPRSLFASVLGRGAVIVGAGLALGSVLALWSARFIQALLFETSSSDPEMLVVAAALVAGSGLAATLPSAVRAMRTDPARSLAA